MNVIDAIKSRRSVRKYLKKEVSQESIDELVEAARLAPSGNNAQPWMFKVITSVEEKRLLKENEIFKQDFVYTAPVLILCCADPDKFPQKKKNELDDSNDLRAIRDLALASQNLVLRATELGLGTCYVGWMDKPKIKELFNLPQRYVVPYVITVGYADGLFIGPKKRDVDDIML